MDTINKPASAIWNIILVSVGILLILWSLISLVKAYNEVHVRTSVEVIPCDVSLDLRFKDTPMPSDTRIVYCITYGYAGGTTHLNEVMAGELKLRRQEQTLFVNDQPLQIGERYDVVRQNPSNNPWLRPTTHFVIVNNGLYSPAPPGSNALYVTGDVKEGWQVRPLGAIILVSGIGLIILGSWGGKRTNIAREQYVMEPSIPRNVKARETAVGFFGWVLFNSVYISLLFLLYWVHGLYVNLYLIWPPTIIAILVLYGMKRFSICKGVVLAVVINSGIWMVISPGMKV